MRGLHGAVNKASLTSVEKEFASQLFDSYIQRKVAELLRSGAEAALGFAIVNGNTNEREEEEEQHTIESSSGGSATVKNILMQTI